MQATKKIIQRQLPTDTEYELISTHYGSVEDGNADCCQNCGRLITNIATVKSKYGTFTVGMDCAGTLTGIKGTFDFDYVHKARFEQAKQARATIQKFIKKGADTITAKTYTDDKNFWKEPGAGKFETDNSKDGGRHTAFTWKSFPSETWQKYVLPMIKDLLKQPS